MKVFDPGLSCHSFPIERELLLACQKAQQTAEDLKRLNETLEERVAQEVAERRKAEAAMRQSQRMEAVGQLTGGVAHDFNNLLTVIKSSTDLLKRLNLSEERWAHYVAAISDTADRAARLTSQLLAFGRRQPSSQRRSMPASPPGCSLT